MTQMIFIFFGGGLGSLVRYGVGLVSLAWFGALFPWGTFIVNVVGGLVMGMFSAFLASRASAPWAHEARLFLMTGILGGFTTFSAFSLDAVALWQKGLTGAAVIYVLASVVLAIAAVVGGIALVKAFT